MIKREGNKSNVTITLGAGPIRQDLRSIIAKNKDLLTLASLLAIIIVFPFFEQSILRDILFDSLFCTLLLSALYEVSDSPRQVAIGVLLAIPTLLAAWTGVFLPSWSTGVAELVTMTVFLAYIILAILRRILATRVVSLTDLYRAVNLYIIIGIGFGLIYALTDLLVKDSFEFSHGEHSLSSFFYFSFGTLSTAGSGDIMAVLPLARSVVIIEMISGVMFMAVLIGLLVNAHYSSRYASGKDDTVTGEPESRGTGSLNLPRISSGGPLLLIVIGVIFNLAVSIAMIAGRLPVFMDTWGTSFAVIAGGFRVGLAAGVVYNIIMAMTFWTPTYAVWAASSLLVAAFTWFFWRRDWIDLRHPHRLLAAGLTTGFLNALLVMTVTALLGLPPYEGTAAVFRFFSGMIGIQPLADVVSTVVVEMTDKTLSLTLAAVVALFLKEQTKTPEPP